MPAVCCSGENQSVQPVPGTGTGVEIRRSNMKIAVLSDTHGLLRPEVLELVRNADAIIHAGDINTQAVVDQLRACAPLYVVRGNNDRDWAEKIPHDLSFSLENLNFYVVHKKSEVPPDAGGGQIVIYGHSHKYACQEQDGVLWLNPGSCGPRRFHQEITMAMLTAENGSWTVEKILIPHETA